MNEQTTIETWAMVRAQQIVMEQGVNLVVAAQKLDHRKTTANTYALREAIMASLIEAISVPPAQLAAQVDANMAKQTA